MSPLLMGVLCEARLVNEPATNLLMLRDVPVLFGPQL
jgi:hypothetical protein